MNTIFLSLVVLGTIGLLAAIILYVVSQKFKVEENPIIDDIEAALPSANCGGCGFPGCRGFAVACSEATDLSNLFCPVGGNDTMKTVAHIVGLSVVETKPKIAVLKCNGTCEHRPRTNQYDGAKSCKIIHNLYIGETACHYGCLGGGDCEVACAFDALHINPVTGIPEIDEEKCTACGACVKACPKLLLELRFKGPKGKRIYVACSNKEKGGIAKKACEVACIGCSKCFKVCPHDAIIIENNLAYIIDDKCRLCTKCVDECPTSSIQKLNFPIKKKEVAEQAQA